jgi:hypothetical protein
VGPAHERPKAFLDFTNQAYFRVVPSGQTGVATLEQPWNVQTPEDALLHLQDAAISSVQAKVPARIRLRRKRCGWGTWPYRILAQGSVDGCYQFAERAAT